MKKTIQILVLMLIAFIGLIGQRYYAWAVTAKSPFDEVGIGLHHYMPGFVQEWGCSQLKMRFDGKTMPPHGCTSAADPRQWRGS